MRLLQTARTLAWLVRDTFRQSLAYGIFWLLLAVSLLSIGVCATLEIEGAAALDQGEGLDFLPRHDPLAQDRDKAKVSGVAIVAGRMSLAFGAITLPLARDARGAVHFLELALAIGVADTLGLLLTLVWTAGFLPGFLDGRSVSVLLAKPVARRTLLAGKFLGVLCFVLFHAAIFVGGCWLAIGCRSGIWEPAFFWAIPILLVHFAIFFSFSMLLAVCTRSTVACVFGSLAFWCVCWGMNFGRHAVLAESYEPTESAIAGPAVSLVDASYWILPKPADIGIMLYDALEAAQSFGKVAAFQSVQSHGDFHPLLSILASLGFMGLLLFAASRQFAALDY